MPKGEHGPDNKESAPSEGAKRRKKSPPAVRPVSGIAPSTLDDLIARTSTLTDSAYYDWLDGKWGRAAEYVLARLACSGDTRALDLYLERVDRRRAEASRAASPRLVTSENRGFLAARATTSDPATSATSPEASAETSDP